VAGALRSIAIHSLPAYANAMTVSELDAAKARLVDAVRSAVPAIRKNRASNLGKIPPPEEDRVIAGVCELLAALKAAGALDRASGRDLGALPISNNELGELVVTFEPKADVTIRRQDGNIAEAYNPDAGGTSLLLLAVADRLAREISAGNLRHDKPDLHGAITLLQEQGKILEAERR
jgi:hypothetical protein